MHMTGLKKTYVDKAPIWCSVDLRDGNQALIDADESGAEDGILSNCL